MMMNKYMKQYRKEGENKATRLTVVRRDHDYDILCARACLLLQKWRNLSQYG